ncbi:MAG: hypothetical protein HKM98_05555, partial [Gammaproteobacteria bacterium]|nr:hypothetical protein [Gammaproteobacteria bacterium]
HRLRNEIISTQITNSIINRMGPAFTNRTMEESGVDAGTLAKAYTIARESFDMRAIWDDIESMDNEIPATAQYAMMIQSSRLLRRATLWLLDRRPEELQISRAVERFQPGIMTIQGQLSSLLVTPDLRAFKESRQAYIEIGMTEKIAERMAGLPPLYAGLDIVDVATSIGVDVSRVASVYFRLAAGLKLDWLREQIEHLKVEGRWQAMARHTMRDNLYELNRILAADIVSDAPKANPGNSVAAWLEKHVDKIAHTQNTLEDMRMGGKLDFATLSVAIQEIRKLTQSG